MFVVVVAVYFRSWYWRHSFRYCCWYCSPSYLFCRWSLLCLFLKIPAHLRLVVKLLYNLDTGSAALWMTSIIEFDMLEVDYIDNEQHGDIWDIEVQHLYCFRLWKNIFEDCIREILEISCYNENVIMKPMGLTSRPIRRIEVFTHERALKERSQPLKVSLECWS